MIRGHLIKENGQALVKFIPFVCQGPLAKEKKTQISNKDSLFVVSHQAASYFPFAASRPAHAYTHTHNHTHTNTANENTNSECS